MIILYGVLSWAFTLGISVGLLCLKCSILDILNKCNNRIGPIKFVKTSHDGAGFFGGLALFQIIGLEFLLGVIINMFLYTKLTPLLAFTADMSILFLFECIWWFLYLFASAWKTLNINLEKTYNDYVETPIVNYIRSVNYKYDGGK